MAVRILKRRPARQTGRFNGGEAYACREESRQPPETSSSVAEAFRHLKGCLPGPRFASFGTATARRFTAADVKPSRKYVAD